MQPEIDTKKIQRKVYLSYFQDGLWDVLLGIFLISWGFAVMFDQAIVPALVWIVLFPFVFILKQNITYPRIGYSRPVEQKKQLSRVIIAGTVTFLLGLIVLLLVFADGLTQFLRDYFELFFGLMLTVIIVLIGFWWKIIRWYFYAALFFIFTALNQWVGLAFVMSFIIPGAAIAFCGLFMFIRFIVKYPRISGEDLDGSR